MSRLSYARAGKWVGCVKSTVCKQLGKVRLAVPELPDGVLEPDGLWMRTGRGRTELKVIRSALLGDGRGRPAALDDRRIRSALLGDGAGRFWPLGGSD